MRRIGSEIKNLYRGFLKATEDEWYDIGDICNGIEIPLTGCAIVMFTDGEPIVLVMVYDSDKLCHAQVEQANQDSTKTIFHDAGANLNLHLKNVKLDVRKLRRSSKEF